jgi:hypothetical protein
MVNFKVLLLAFLFFSCASHDDKDSTDSRLDKIREKKSFYLELIQRQVDDKGWIPDTKCDGLLFNSLYSISGGNPKIEDARSNGLWYRFHTHDCYSRNESASSISRDMFWGLFLYIWINKRRDLIEQIINYGEQHKNSVGSWVMGEGDKFRTDIRPNMQATAYEIRYRLGGASHGKRWAPRPYLPVRDFEAHLQVIELFLRGKLTGGLNAYEMHALERNHDREKKNALFQAVWHNFHDGNQTRAIEILLDEKLFPSDRLPQSEDRCSWYLWERDYMRGGKVNPDWLPCDSKFVTHSPVDFLFAASIVLGDI